MKQKTLQLLFVAAVMAVGFLGLAPQVSAVACDPTLPSDSNCGQYSETCVSTDPNDPHKGECVARNAASLDKDPKGLVPCTTNCDFCDLFTMIERIVHRLFLEVVPIVATLLVVLAGLIMLTSFGKPERISKAWEMLRNVILGLFIMYASWIVVHGVLAILIDEDSSVYDIVFPWNDIECKLGGAPAPDTPPSPPQGASIITADPAANQGPPAPPIF